MSSKKKVITIVVTTAALSLGSIGIAAAANSKSSFKVKSTAVTRSITNQGIGIFGRIDMDGQNGVLASVLADLVTKGTLTQAQVDAINAAITAARTANQTQGASIRAAHENLIATTLGITVATLETRLAAGDSLATIAGAKTPALIAALVADVSAKIDAAVTAGQITTAQATTLKTNLTAHITAMVNATGGIGRGIGRMGEGRGHHGLGLGIDAGGVTAMSLRTQS